MRLSSIEYLHNTVHCMDCLEFMKGLPDNCIDLTVTSPPYDELRDYKWYDFDFENIASELYRITNDGWVVVWVVWDATVSWSETGTSFKQALYFKECWFNIHDTMIREKPSCNFPDFNRYYQLFEYMFVFSKGPPTTSNLIADKKNKYHKQKVARRGGDRQKDWQLTPNSAFKNNKDKEVKQFWVRWNVWKMSTTSSEWNSTKSLHPATFPDELAQAHIETRSNKWDIVFDPFSWSWTTLVASKELWRSYIWCEISRDYLYIIHKRLRNTTISLFHS